MTIRSVSLFILCIIAGFPIAMAQTPQVALSASFPEPSADGWDKLVLLANGNTCYLHFDKSDGIQTALYNANRELLASDKISGKGWDTRDMNDTEIDGVYEINGQVVIFLQQLIKYKPNLFRIVIDGNTGHWVQEDKIGELPTVLHRDAIALNNLASHDFYVAKDPYSGHYAVAFFAGGELSRKETPRERIKVLHFAPDHQLLNQAFYTLPDSTTYPYFSYLDMAVQGKNSVYLCTVAFNTKKMEDRPQSEVWVSALKAGQTEFTHQPMGYTANFGNAYADLQWSPVTQKLQLLLLAAPEAKAKPDERRYFMNYLDAATCALLQQRPLQLDKIAPGPYSGQPQLMTVQPNGITTLQLEQMQEFSQGKNVYNMLHTTLGDVGICSISPAGQEDSGYVVPKQQVANGGFQPLYLQRKNRGAWVFRNRVPALNTTPYLSFDYIHTAHGDYTLFNDYLQFLDRGGQFEDRKPLRYLTEANIICYYHSGAQTERMFLFGKPETDKAYYCMLGASDRKAGENKYATILITRTAAEKKAQIAWITF
ncbi:hypothetical protein F0L74_20660 [Chitinophaga agrisoli]|uniref:Uncharacterized protein n=1 Tax=Chitinophaga agrisoli TaxID=2607653 RepID=A0A5B2VK68_9BACT|nr:hypothetical protein [Chitinophaga agrisoli]KAA2238639.1 hypothetical protein F0L74_20660 [Chitinophaga agrisoli]